MITYVVKSFSEYIDLITKIGSVGFPKWFRGQSKCEYRLTPSAFREIYAIEDQRGNRFEKPIPDNPCSGSNNIVAYLPVDKMVEEFSKGAKDCLEYSVSTRVEWECIAQHYGIPTRLLDWTTNAINALYFAVCDCSIGDTENEEEDIEYFLDSEGHGKGGGAVFVIDPIEINKQTVPIKDFEKNPVIFNAIDDAEIIDTCLHEAIPPVCFSGFNKEKRISRQAGKFTTSGTLMWPLDYINVLQEHITKIFIPYSSFESIRGQLRALGITRETIYVEDDDKDILARNIATKTKTKFTELMNKN